MPLSYAVRQDRESFPAGSFLALKYYYSQDIECAMKHGIKIDNDGHIALFLAKGLAPNIMHLNEN